jgi:hypothetical protein
MQATYHNSSDYNLYAYKGYATTLS